MNMKFRANYAVLLCLLPFAAVAAPQLEVGKVLSGKELATLNRIPVKVGDKVLHVVALGSPAPQGRATTQTSGQPTWVVNSLGALGRSFNEVMVGGVPTDVVRQQLTVIDKPIVGSKYFDATRISILRFRSFTDAAAAQDSLRRLLPQAQVSLPIEYSKKQQR